MKAIRLSELQSTIQSTFRNVSRHLLAKFDCIQEELVIAIRGSHENRFPFPAIYKGQSLNVRQRLVPKLFGSLLMFLSAGSAMAQGVAHSSYGPGAKIPPWTSSVLGRSDTQTAKLMANIRSKFSNVKTAREARKVAASLSTEEPRTLEIAITVLLASYHLDRFGPRNSSDQYKLDWAWKTFCKEGNPKSPEQALIACITSSLVSGAKVSAQTARSVFYRFDGRPETSSLIRCYYAKLPLKPSQDYLDLIEELERRIASFPKGLVFDHRKDEHSSRMSLRASIALFHDIMAANPEHRSSKAKAKAMIQEVLKDPLIDKELRRTAEILRDMFEGN